MAFNILPIFIPFIGCKKICLFCNQESITGFSKKNILEHIESQINLYLSYSKKWNEVAIYGGTFTSLPIDIQKSILDRIKNYIQLPIRISTRPDFINDEILKILTANNIRTVELGIQSMSEKVLKANNRDYTNRDVLLAIDSLRKYPLTIGIQIMCGLFKENKKDFLDTVDKLLQADYQYVRIYPVLVLKGSALEQLYYNNMYKPLTLEKAIKYTAYAFIRFTSNGKKVIRMGLLNNKSLESNLVAGPYHSAFGDLVKIFILSLYLCKNNVLCINNKYNNYINSYGHFLKKRYEKHICFTEDNIFIDWQEICKKLDYENNSWFFEEQTDKIAKELTYTANN